MFSGSSNPMDQLWILCPLDLWKYFILKFEDVISYLDDMTLGYDQLKYSMKLNLNLQGQLTHFGGLRWILYGWVTWRFDEKTIHQNRCNANVWKVIEYYVYVCNTSSDTTIQKSHRVNWPTSAVLVLMNCSDNKLLLWSIIKFLVKLKRRPSWGHLCCMSSRNIVLKFLNNMAALKLSYFIQRSRSNQSRTFSAVSPNSFHTFTHFLTLQG